MIRTIFLCCALVGSQGAEDPRTAPAEPSADIEAYLAAQSKVGRDPDAHVRLALWCEAHGLKAEQLKHLSLAVLANPSHALARGLLGLVAFQGKWDRPDVVGPQIQNDPARKTLINEYLNRRARTPDKAEAQMKLAAWCAERGLNEQALAHYSVVTRLDPSREAAWKHLGYKKQGGQWVKPDEVAAVRQEAAQQKHADKYWKAELEQLRAGLLSKDALRRSKAESALREVMDPRAVPMIWSVFVRGGERLQFAAVQVLGQIDGPSASNGLAVLAVFSSSAEVRSRAIGTLNRRDPRDVVGRLIGLIHKPYKYQVRHVNGPGSPGELFVEGERFNLHRFYQNVNKTPNIYRGRLYTPDIPFDPYSIQNLVLATIPNFVLNPGLAQVPGANLGNSFATYPLPVSPQSAALAAKAMAANPQSASAILGHLINNPENRYAPPGYWFYPNQPNGIAANRPVTQPQMQQGPASPANMAAMAHLVEAANRAAINQMAMNQQSLSNPQHHAGPVHRQETGSANAQSSIALGMMDTGQTLAAQRDLQIAQELEGLRQANLELEQRLAMDVQFVETTNDGINLCNDRTLPVLQSITGQDLGAAPEKWKSWWTDQLGYVYQTESPENKPTYTDVVANRVVRSSCFAAGTLVQTIDGARPIETIRVGDRVLSQGTSTGQLSFQPVVATHRSQPTETLRIAITGESIVATGIHRFWKAGKGWVMARELKAGDNLRMVGGTVTVAAIEPDQAQVVYNLDIAINRDFFVGRSALLVHDYSFVQPVLEPFDKRPELTAQAAASQ